MRVRFVAATLLVVVVFLAYHFLSIILLVTKPQIVSQLQDQSSPVSPQIIGHDSNELFIEGGSLENNDQLFVLHEVPFVSQAPFGEWDDPKQQDGCEEASALMAARWHQGRGLNKFSARQEMTRINAWEEARFGFSTDTSAVDTAKILSEYFFVPNHVSEEVTVHSLRSALQLGTIVIIPVNGRKLGNPFFSGEGPDRHMLVIIGYDDETREFITNDPGTKRGEGYRYSYEILLAANRNYPSGIHEPILSETKAMIVVGAKNT